MTVRQRLLIFTVFAMIAVTALAFLTRSTSLRSDAATRDLIDNRFDSLWHLTVLEQDHWQLVALAQKAKAQLLLWDEVDRQFQTLKTAMNIHWQELETRPGLSNWIVEVEPERQAVQDFMARLSEDIEGRSYYEVGVWWQFSPT